MSASKKWCYTLNNWTTPLELPASYHVFGEEVGESGTPHLQGFVILQKPMRLTQLKKICPTAHWEKTKGTNKQASDYCKKDGKFTEIGILPESPNVLGGKAMEEKYKRAFELAQLGEFEEMEKSLLTKHYRTYKQIKLDHIQHLDPLDETCGIWYYGESGSGKSSTARNTYPNSYLKQCNKWWDGYQEEPYVIIDDFDKSHACLAHYLKIWSDHYEFMGETKGGQIKLRPLKIIVTSQYCIDQIWEDYETCDALGRRFSQIKIS